MESQHLFNGFCLCSFFVFFQNPLFVAYSFFHPPRASTKAPQTWNFNFCFIWVLLMFFSKSPFSPYRFFYPPRAPSKNKWMESQPVFSLGLAYVFVISFFSSLKKIVIPLGSQKTQQKSPKRTGRQRSHSRIFFFSWDRWDG